MRYAAHPLLPSLLLLLAGCGIEPSSAVGEATAVRGRLPVLAGAPCTDRKSVV